MITHVVVILAPKMLIYRIYHSLIPISSTNFFHVPGSSPQFPLRSLMGGAPSLEEGKFEEVGWLYMVTRNGIVIIRCILAIIVMINIHIIALLYHSNAEWNNSKMSYDLYL